MAFAQRLSTDDDADITAMASLSLDSGLTGSRNASPSKSAGGSKENRTMGNGKKTKSDSESESSSDEEGERKAPNQLIMEFLDCVMSNDLENGLKLCKMILLYEPNNSKALKFLPLLQEKKEQDEAESEDDTDNSDEMDDSDSDDETGDDSSSSSDEEAEDDDSKKSKPNGHCTKMTAS
ncbi:glutamate-rich protein 2-like isoform X2 [Watersipora subatra]|uniref:glutamate-rich protein 2-like isoform X2 n=1 Tax=Watersipora subatra TaxID=2589382 RepID=UPI00355B6D1C